MNFDNLDLERLKGIIGAEIGGLQDIGGLNVEPTLEIQAGYDGKPGHTLVSSLKPAVPPPPPPPKPKK